jgi:ferric-dicitrate binding protein FerR (iron transport regulator)
MVKEDQQQQNSFWLWLKKHKWIVLVILIIAIILIVVGYLYFKPTTTAFVNQSSTASVVKINNNIQATLAKGSSFRQIEDSTQLTLQYEVVGDAYFDIQPSERSVLLIGSNGLVTLRSGKLMIKQTEQSFEVLVMEGEAKLSKSLKRSFNEGLNLSENELGRVGIDIEGIVKRVNRNPNYTAWVTKKIIFEGTLLSEALVLLEEIYGQKVQLPSTEAGNCRVVGVFDNATFEVVLYEIVKDLNLTVSKNAIEYNLQGVGCL